jgi:hypothetical protein
MSNAKVNLTLDAVPSNVRRELRIAVPFGIGVVQSINAVGLYDLAVAVGWAQPLPFLMPASLIVFDVMATRMWFKTPKSRGRLRRLSMINAFLGMGLTYALNAVWHAIEGGDLRVTLPLKLAVTAVPTIVGAMLMMMEAMSSDLKVPAEISEPSSQELPSEVPVSLELPVEVPTSVAPIVASELPTKPAPKPEVPAVAETPEPRKPITVVPNPEDGTRPLRKTVQIAMAEIESARAEGRKLPSGQALKDQHGMISDKGWRNALSDAKRILEAAEVA